MMVTLKSGGCFCSRSLGGLENTQEEEVIIYEELGAHVCKPNVRLKSVHQSTHPLLIKRSDLIECADLSLE